jgi:predicted alpha/beta-hydrolase family hydrolase
MTTLTIDAGIDGHTTGLAYTSQGPPANATFVLAHGAGAGQQSAFITGFARGLTGRGIDVLTFNFLYTEQARRVPDRTEKLEACYRAAVGRAASFRPRRVFIGGKSMGGRIATHLAAGDDADELGIRGVVALGYPLHPPGKPQQLRAAHLSRIRVPMLIVQGERDPFGTPPNFGHCSTRSPNVNVPNQNDPNENDPRERSERVTLMSSRTATIRCAFTSEGQRRGAYVELQQRRRLDSFPERKGVTAPRRHP